MTEPTARPGDRIRVHRTGAFGIPTTFTATVVENCKPHGYRIKEDYTGETWLMAPTSLVRKHGGEQTIELIEENS